MAPRLAAKVTGKKKTPAATHKLPDPIREGEILQDIQKRKWRLGKSIGVGGFGEIYAASDLIDKPVSSDASYVIKIEPHSNGPLFVEMNFYIRVAKSDLIDEWKKSHQLKFLGMPRFIGSGSHEYKKEKYRFMVMERFGTDIQKLFEANNRQLPLNTVLNLGLRIIDVLEYIHDKQYVHADIKGSNLLLGFGKGNENQVWLVDFGLACRYTTGGVHKEYKPDLRKAHNGTIEFTSRDAHIGANGRRGDFEILGYNLLQWMCGRLPWEDNLSDPEYVAAQKNKYMSNVSLLMKQCFSGQTAPGVIQRFLEMVAKMSFEETPNYEKFRQLLKQGIKEGGYNDDGKLVFPSLKSSSGGKSPKKRTLPAIKFSEDAENVDTRKQRLKPEVKAKEPTTPKTTTMRARRVNQAQDDDHDASSSHQKSNTSQPKERKVSQKLDESLNNPTPAMLAILARLRNKPDPSPVLASKKKHARMDSEPSTPVVEKEPSLILTPAMQDVIRVREVRKSMEQSGHFFTPVCSPDTSDEEPVRKKSGGKGSSPPVLRSNRRDTLQLDSSSSVDSSTAAEISVTPEAVPRRVIHKRKYKVVSMASASTQTSPGVLQLPPLQREPYGLRSAQNSGKARRPPPVIELSPDIFKS